MRQSPPPRPTSQEEQDSRVERGIIATLSAGFELTTNHLWLIVLPILLDLFFWLGPRLSIQQIVEESLAIFAEEPAVAASVDQLLSLAPQINLFTSLSIPLLGIPTLMGGTTPVETPIEPAVYAVNSASVWFVLVTAFSLIGLLLTTVYLGLIARSIQPPEIRPHVGRFPASLAQASLRLFGLGIAFVLLVMLVSLPLLPIGLILAFLSGSLFAVVMITAVILVTVYLSLAVPGILLNYRPLLPAILESFRLVRVNVFSIVSFYIVILVISSGMNLLWRLADDGSWITLVSIAGHGFVSTSLAAAIFIYYRDRFAAWQSRLSRFEFRNHNQPET